MSRLKDFVIVIAAYRRTRELKVLLNSLERVYSENTVDLVISIDDNGTEELNSLAEGFYWRYGQKSVVIHRRKLGLVEHFFWVGDRTEDYQNVIFLEEDLFVSPHFLNFTFQLIDFYKNDSKISCISLYSPAVNEMTGTRFFPLKDDSDVFFFQQPYWGTVWFRDYWKKFRFYMQEYSVRNELLPTTIQSWKKSFKKIYIQFMIEYDLYSVYPRTSLVTNQCSEGLHSSGRNSHFQNIIELVYYRYNLVYWSASISIYDAYMEILPNCLKRLNPSLREFDFDVDLHGCKHSYNCNMVLTDSRNAKKLEIAFNGIMKPRELAVALDLRDNNGLAIVRVDNMAPRYSLNMLRRYRDVKANYHLGVLTTIFLFFDMIKYLMEMIISRVKKWI